MAEDVSIFQEIDEALRADKVQQFWTRNSGTIIAFCVLLVVSTAASEMWKAHQRNVHTRQTTELAHGITLTEGKKYDDAIAMFAKAEADGGPVGALAGLKHAQVLVEMKQPDKAIALYNDVAAGRAGSAPETLRDFAALQADVLAHNAAEGGAKPVATEGGEAARRSGRPFAPAFNELDALRSTDTKASAAHLSAIIADPLSPYSARERAGEELRSLKGAGQ